MRRDRVFESTSLRAFRFSTTRRLVGLTTLLIVIALLIAPAASACPVCYGSPDDPMVKATNKGIWVLLGFVGFVQIGFGALFFAFWRRARQQKRFRDSFHIVEGGPLS